jgi:hypothetical protein
MGTAIALAIPSLTATTAAGVTSLTLAGVAVAAVINIAIAALLGKILAPDRTDGRDTRGLQRTVRNNILPRRVVYGECLAGGPYVVLETIGNNNEELTFVIALAAHPLDDVLGVILNDQYLNIGGTWPTSGTNNNDLSSTYHIDNGVFGSLLTNTDRFELVKLVKNLGYGYADFNYVTDGASTGATDDRTRAAEISSTFDDALDWTTPTSTVRDSTTGLYDNDIAPENRAKLTNIAHIMCRFRYEPAIFSGWPTPNFHVKGKRLYNPYLDPNLAAFGADSAGTHDYNDPDTWEWSEDWTLCALDYLINTEYGLGAKVDLSDPLNPSVNEIDWEAMIQSYLESSEIIDNGLFSTDPDYGTGPRYTLNGLFEVGDTPISIMEAILTSGGGELVYAQGRYSLRSAVYRAPNSENDIINEDMIVGPLNIQTHAPRSDLFNKAAGVYVDKGYDESLGKNGTNLPLFVSADFELVDPLDSSGFNPFEVIDGEEIIQHFDFPFTTRNYEAQRLARIQLERVRRGLTINLKATLEVLKYSVGNTVYLEILNDSKYATEAFFNRLGLDDEVQDRPDTPFSPYYKQFKIISMEYAEDFTIDVTMVEESETIYDWNSGDASPDEGSLISDLVIENPLDSVEPPSFLVASPAQTITEVNTGTGISTQLRWTAPDRGSIINQVDRAHIEYYRMEFGVVDVPIPNSPYTAVDRVTNWSPSYNFTPEDRDILLQGPITLTDLFIDATTGYDFRLKSVTFSGRSSAWVYYSDDIGSDYIPPAPANASRYYIKPVDGTVIQNSTGILTVEAREVTSSGDNLITTGDIKLYVGSLEVTTANGYASPSDGYTGTFDAGDIGGSVVVELRDDTEALLLDTITLADITDGSDGSNAVYGYVEPIDTLVWMLLEDGTWNPVATSTNLDVTFVQGGSEVGKWSRTIDRDSVGVLSDGGAATHDSGSNLNTGRITPTVWLSAGGSPTLAQVNFTYNFGGDVVTVVESVQVAWSAAERYYIKADTTALKNSAGTITLEARQVNSSGDVLVTSPSIYQLYDENDNLLSTDSPGNYPSPSDGYTGTLDASSINGDLTVYLRRGPPPGGFEYDTITVVDVTDGTASVVGWMEPEFLAWRRDVDAGAWVPAGTTTQIDIIFNVNGSDVARQGYEITRTASGTLTGATNTASSPGNLNTSRITLSTVGAGTTNFTLKADYSFGGLNASVSETVFSVASGDTGSPGVDSISGYLTSLFAPAGTNWPWNGTPTLPANPVSEFKMFQGETEVTDDSGTDFQVLSPDTQNGVTATIINTPGSTQGEISLSGTWDGNLTEWTFNGTYSGVTIEAAYGIAIAQEGQPGFSVVLTNDSHSIPVTNLGVHDYTGSGTTIEAFVSENKLVYDDTSPYTDGSFRVTNVSASNITAGSASYPSPGDSVVYADASAMTADTASITYTLIVRNNNGEESTVTRVQTLSRSVDGDEGAEGPTGPTGDPGVDGADGEVGWGHDLIFSSLDDDTVAWTSGTIWTAAGGTYPIESPGADTGNMTARTYIYFDSNSPTPTTLSTTTTAQTSVGLGKILIAVAEDNIEDSPNVGEAFFQVFGGAGGLKIAADEIAANSIISNNMHSTFFEGAVFTGGIFQTRKPLTSLPSPLPSTSRSSISTDGQLQIQDDTDQIIFSITDTGDGAEINIMGDFATGSLNTANMYSETGIEHLRGRLGTVPPAGLLTGGTIQMTNEFVAITEVDTEILRVSPDDPNYKTNLTLNTLDFTFHDSQYRQQTSNLPYTAPVWHFEFFYTDDISSPITWTPVPGLSSPGGWSAAGTTANEFDGEFNEWLNSFIINSSRQLTWTPASPFAAEDEIYYMLRSSKTSGSFANPKFISISANEALEGSDTIASFDKHDVIAADISPYAWTGTGTAVADASDDTLTWVPGAGISLSVDTALDAIRITSTVLGDAVKADNETISGEWIFDAANVDFENGTDIILHADDSNTSVTLNHNNTDFRFAVTGTRFNTLPIIFDGFESFEMDNYTFDCNQTVGAGQDNYVLTYDDATKEISLEAGAGGLGASADETISGTWQFTAQPQMDYGIGGSYSDDAVATWGGTMWSLDETWQGATSGTNSASTNVYGIRWLRLSHPDAHVQVDEGVYGFTAGNREWGIGQDGLALFLGNRLTVYDATDTNLIQVFHGGTDANIAVSTATDVFRFTGPASFNFDDNVMVTGGISADGGVSDIGQAGQFAFMDVSGGFGRFGSYSYDSPTGWEALKVQGSDIQFAIDTTVIMDITSSSVQLLTGQDLWVRDGGHLVIYDGTDADSMDTYHTGANLSTTLTNTNNWQIHGGSGFQLRDGSSFYVYDSGNTYVLRQYAATNDINFEFTGVTDWDIIGLSGNAWIRDGAGFKVSNSADTDFVIQSHDGTYYNFVGTQTDAYRFQNAPIFLEEQAAAATFVANYGQLFVRNDAPNTIHYVNDLGDEQLVDPSVSEINTQNGNYTFLIEDKGKTIRKATGGAGETYTIPANSSVAYPDGTMISIHNVGGGALTIAITTDTLTSVQDGSTGSQSLSSGYRAIIQKVGSTGWTYAATDFDAAAISAVSNKTSNYQTVLADKGGTIRGTSGTLIFTIAPNVTEAYAIGTFLGFSNDTGNTMTIAIGSPDTLTFAEDGTTGDRTLADDGMAVAQKVTTTGWKITGTGLT